MSYILHDPDEWEAVSTYTPCLSCNGDLTRCDGRCTGSASYGMRRRPPEVVAEIKAKKLREHEDAVLAEADRIRARRAP